MLTSLFEITGNLLILFRCRKKDSTDDDFGAIIEQIIENPEKRIQIEHESLQQEMVQEEEIILEKEIIREMMEKPPIEQRVLDLKAIEPCSVFASWFQVSNLIDENGISMWKGVRIRCIKGRFEDDQNNEY